jgi:hypothetical protein
VLERDRSPYVLVQSSLCQHTIAQKKSLTIQDEIDR